MEEYIVILLSNANAPSIQYGTELIVHAEEFVQEEDI